jgi:hypothetical protein
MITRYQHLVMQRSDADEFSDDLAPVEALVGGPLPQDFAAFLRAANGCMVYYDLAISKGKKKNRVLPFHVIHRLGVERSKQRPWTIAGLSKLAHAAGAPSSYIEFALHPSMLLFYYDAPPRGTGQVLVSKDVGKFSAVAESFEEYIRGLKFNYDSVYKWLQMVVAGADPRGMRNMREWLDAAVPDWRTRWEVPEDALADSP